MNQVLKDGKAILIKDAAADPRFLRARSVVSTFKTALCVPLLGRDGRPLGMVQIDRMKGRKGFRAGDLDLLAALAVPVGVAVENDRLLKERASWAAAREIQLSLLPRGRPEIPGYAFWDCYAPTLEVGGDLYDYIAVEPSAKTAGGPNPAPGRWVVVIGDVAGKGMPAALVVAGICPEVRHLVRAGVAPEEVLSQVNRSFCDREVGGRFVTMALVAIDPESHVLTVVKAGHPDPLVRRASGAIEPVGRSGAGPPLGVTPRSVYKPVSVDARAGRPGRSLYRRSHRVDGSRSPAVWHGAVDSGGGARHPRARRRPARRSWPRCKTTPPVARSTTTSPSSASSANAAEPLTRSERRAYRGRRRRATGSLP